MQTNNKFDLISKNLAEIITEDDLKNLINDGIELKHYIGFEISGKIHLGTGLVTAYKIKDLIEAGVKTTIFLADWHTWINDKLGGDMQVIRGIGTKYFVEGFKASMMCVGVDYTKVNFVTGLDLYRNSDYFWETVIDISKNTSLSRMKRSVDITGRQSGENIDFAKLIYPAMQVADIFTMNINLAHAGMDQRKAHVIARDVALNLKNNNLKNSKGEKIKPIAIHHPLILGLGKPSVWPLEEGTNLRDIWTNFKMSKSKPDTAVFITDEPAEIERKINGAFCPEGEVEFNPILNWAKSLLFINHDFSLEIKRPTKWGGNMIYTKYEELEKAFKEKSLHPQDLKQSVSKEIIKLLEPARKHFEISENKELKDKMDKLVITR